MTAHHGLEIAVLLIVLAVLLAAFLVAVLRRRRNIYGKLWSPLLPLVNGTAQGSRLSGTYRGLPVTARIAGDDGEIPSYHYELTLTPGPSPADWSLSYTGAKFLGTGDKTWRVKSKDDELRQRLTAAGVPAAVQDWAGQPEITYKSRTGTLHYWQPVTGPYDLPTPDAFQSQLDLLARLAEINTQANTA